MEAPERLRADAEALFLRELATIERAIRHACRRYGLAPQDAADFTSYVTLKLIDDDYHVIRKYEHRSSFAAFISVVVQRCLLDYRIAQWGKWHASAKAQRLGEPAVTMEAMLVRDGHTLDEVFPLLVRRWPDLTRERANAIAAELPDRERRPRAQALDPESVAFASSDADTDEVALATHRRSLSSKIESVVRAAFGDLEDLDRLILRLRFEGAMTVAEISRTLRLDQKPLYRRLERGLRALRRRLEGAGITARDAEEVLASRHGDLDFGFVVTFDGEKVAGKEDS